MNTTKLFVPGTCGYSHYRIPALLATKAGRLIAFCEGRRDSLSDTGAIDIVSRVSDDSGKTWSPQKTILHGNENTIGNPTPVQSSQTGLICLFFNGNGGTVHEKEILEGKARRSVGYIVSRDNGETWGIPQDLTDTLSKPNWTWYACGPCHAAEMPDGRLVIPCNHGEFPPPEGALAPYRGHLLLSDDGGISWRIGAEAGTETNEVCVAPLPDGSLYVNFRSGRGHSCRQVYRSQDGGETLDDGIEDEVLVESWCQGTCLSVGNRLYFMNPAHPTDRVNLTLRSSEDGGKTWSSSETVCAGWSAYSDMQALDGRLHLLWETGENSPYEWIEYRSLPL